MVDRDDKGLECKLYEERLESKVCLVWRKED